MSNETLKKTSPQGSNGMGPGGKPGMGSGMRGPGGPGMRGPGGPGHGPGRGRIPMGPRVENPGALLKRLIGYVMKSYKFHIIIVAVCIIGSVLANVQGMLFTQTLIDDYIAPLLLTDAPDFTPLAYAI